MLSETMRKSAIASAAGETQPLLHNVNGRHSFNGMRNANGMKNVNSRQTTNGRYNIYNIHNINGGQHSSVSNSSTSNTRHNVLSIPLVTGAGLLFGIALQKGRVSDPMNIAAQFTFEKFIMMKMFISALGTSMTMLSAMSLIPFTRPYYDAAMREYATCCRRGLLQASLGGALLGMGMVTAGSCPGNVLLQLGALVQHSGVTFLGGLFGCAAYFVAEPIVRQFISPVATTEHTFAKSYLPSRSYVSMALPATLACFLVVAGLEYAVPWQSEVNVTGTGSGSAFALPAWTDAAWPPYMAGVLVGLLQVPLLFAVGDTAGSSGAYATVSGAAIKNLAPDYAAKHPAIRAATSSDLRAWWQLLYAAGSICGAFLAANASGVLGAPPGLPLTRSFIGGFLLLFGARMAGGCTSGHGISGMSFFAMNSLVATPAMFAGGIGLGFVYQALGM
eukprot:Clim_evm7s37 gene=Clim_evmTU7s37